jgi:hypothetical protein
MNLQPNLNFEELKKKLDQFLSNSFRPHIDEIPKIKSKGIYFWFMKTEGYNLLSKYIEIKPIDPRYSKEIDGVKYDLVYLGTAGTGKKGKSNLYDRFNWHILQHHSESNVCHGTLSTLRAGLGSVLFEDLILPNIEEAVNSFMKSNMIIFYVEYPDDKKLIDSDEFILIKGFKPLLNLKNNSNASLQGNPTPVYKTRRAFVYQNTRLRLNCTGEESSVLEKINLPTENAPSFQHQVLTEEKGCITYFVLNGQDISVITRGIEELPQGKCKIDIWDSNDSKTRFEKWHRTTGKNEDGQNIYTYFSNTSSDNKTKRSEVIFNWMNEFNIKEITVRVCPII